MSAPPPKDGSTAVNLFRIPSETSRLLKVVLDTEADIDLVIPKEATPQQLFKQLETCCRSYSLLDNAQARLRPVIGKLLALCQEHPETYLEQGLDYYDIKTKRQAKVEDFQTFLRYVSKQFGFARTKAYEELRTVKQWPDLTLNEYAQIGTAKFAILNSAGYHQKDSGSKQVLQQAKKMTISQLRSYTEQVRHLPKGDTIGAIISFGTTRTIKTLWENTIRDPKTIEVVESENPGRILEAILQEWRGTYGL